MYFGTDKLAYTIYMFITEITSKFVWWFYRSIILLSMTLVGLGFIVQIYFGTLYKLASTTYMLITELTL